MSAKSLKDIVKRYWQLCNNNPKPLIIILFRKGVELKIILYMGRRTWPRHAPQAQSRHLRRARRRSRYRQILPQDRPELRELLAVPCADRKIGRGAGGVRRSGEGLIENFKLENFNLKLIFAMMISPTLARKHFLRPVGELFACC